MMTTWQLWRALNHPPARYPLFWRPIKTRPAPRYSQVNWRLLSSWLMIFGAVLLCASGGAPYGLQMPLYFLAVAAFFSPLLFLLRFTVLDGMYYGLIWSLSMSHTLIKERERQTYELLCLLPGGALAASWALCLGLLYYDHALRGANTRHQSMLVIVAIAGGFVSIAALGNGQTAALKCIYATALLALWLYLEFAQSVVLGTLIALLIPTYTSSRLEAGVMTPALFVLSQVAAGTLALVADFVAQPSYTGHWLAEALAPLGSILLFFALREAMIVVGWRLLTQRLSLAPSEQTTHFYS